MTQPQTPKVISERERDFIDYYEYGEIHFHAILQKLRCIDRARENLIAAQNDLASFLSVTTNNYTQLRFAEFYAAGGVTAADWQVAYVDKYQEPDLTLKTNGQLRVVRTPRESVSRKSVPQ